MHDCKTVVLYAFHEVNDRVKHFLSTCVFDDPNVDFVLISNSVGNYASLQVPSYAHMYERANIGHDFGAWSYGLEQIDISKYKYFIFANSTIQGPYLDNETPIAQWTYKLLQGLQKPNVKLFGCTINGCSSKQYAWSGKVHVQSYLFCMSDETLRFLINEGIFSTKCVTKSYRETIQNKEIQMSQLILAKQWNIGCRLKCYENFDFTKPITVKLLDDVTFDVYCNRIWTPQEVMFVKGNRNLQLPVQLFLH